MNTMISSDKAIAFWQSHRIPRAAAHSAFDAEGMSHLIPAVDHYAALQRAAADVIDAYKIDAQGKVRPFPLGGRSDAVGIEVRRIIKGKTRNTMPFLFSLGAVEQADGSHEIEVLEADGALCPEVANNLSVVGMKADQYWRDACDFIIANDLTNAITGLLRASHGFLADDHGKVWYVPADQTAAYLNVARALQQHGVQMHICIFDPVVNSQLMRHMSDTLVKRSLAVFDGQIDEITDLQQRGSKPRKNGQQTRLEEWIAAKETLDANRELLGKAFVAVTKAANAAREAIGEEALKAFV